MEEVKKQGMESIFVPYEQALALKELGFDEPCLGFYDEFSNNEVAYGLADGINSAPTFSQAFRWFREKYAILVVIDVRKSSGYGLNSAFFHTIKVPINQIQFKIITNTHNSKEDLFKDWISKKAHKTYEEAELTCLKKLIEIVKKNNC